MSDFAPLATVSRGGVAESTHLGDLVVCNTEGKLLASLGNPDRRAYYRSSGKPLQALSVMLSGAAEQFSFTDTELAVCCASHSGASYHVETVRGILEKVGVKEEHLACGIHAPGDEAERARLAREGQSPSPLHNNCSGKHAGMLAVSVALGAPVAGYLEARHPVQRHIRQVLSHLTGLPEAELHEAPDGCGAPTIAVSLQVMALTFARLANPAELSPEWRRACERIVTAMSTAPEMVSAEGSFNTLLLAAGNGRLVAKAGAEGLMLIGLKDPRHLGIAFKIADGSGRPHGPVTLQVLRSFGALGDSALAELAPFSHPQVANCHGEVVGAIEAAFTLQR